MNKKVLSNTNKSQPKTHLNSSISPCVNKKGLTTPSMYVMLC